MKNLAILIVLTFLISCKAGKEEINQKTTYHNSEILIGKADKNGFLQEPFNKWFVPNFDNYQIDDALVEELKPLLKGIKITAFMGTWCGDSKRETPHFYKILEAADYNFKHLTLITVDRKKTTPQGYEKDLNITNVPTFIFYKDGKEINRIVEYPIESLEKDMLSILKGEDYKHAYAE